MAYSAREAALPLPECHFAWQLEKDAIKKLKNVRKNALEKLNSDKLNRVGYYTLLAYVHSQPDTVGYRKAEACLKSADEVCQKVQSGELSPDYLTCQFVIDANRLCIQRERKQNTSELPMKFQELQTRWENLDSESRAAVFAVKGLALLRFGLSKYPQAVDAYAEANRLSQRRKLLFLFGESNLRARIRRSKSPFTPADTEEVALWQAAHAISSNAATEFDHAQFLVLYAEAMLNNHMLEFCKLLADEAWNEIKCLAHDVKVKRYRILLKGAKCYRVLKNKYREIGDTESNEKIEELEASVTDLHSCFLSMKDEIPNVSVLFHFANELHTARKLVECRRLLEQAQKVADKPGHVYVDCKLLFMKEITQKELNETYTVEDYLADYDNLIAKFVLCSTDIAIVLLNKSDYLLRCSRFEDSFHAMIEADRIDSTCWKRLGPDRLKFLYEEFDGSTVCRKEYKAWILKHVKERIVKLAPEVGQYDVQAMYVSVLDEEPSNQFALEHLGKLHLSKQHPRDAEACFRTLLSLSPTIENNKLLASAMLSTGKKDNLKECCTLGCKDACEKLLQILIQEKDGIRKPDETWLIRQSEGYNNGKTDLQHMSHCSRDTYELCALIHSLVDGDSGFYIHKPDDERLHCDKIIFMIQQLLEISTSEDGSTDRPNALRRARYQATRLKIRGELSSSSDFRDEVGKTLKEAKESLDRATRLLRPNSFHDFYVHGFNGLTKELQKIPEFNKQKSKETDKQLTEQQLVELMMTNNEMSSCQKISACLKSQLKKTGHLKFASDDQAKQIFEFLVCRESAILTIEGPWLIRWIYGANREKHSKLQNFDELNAQLESHGRGVKSAYEMAHRAAEFAEETRLVMMSWRSDEKSHDGDALPGDVPTDDNADDTESHGAFAGLFE